MSERYYKVVLVGTQQAGAWSGSRRVGAALESLGHTVLPFTPALWPQLFDAEGAFDASQLATFARVQRPDALLLADGVAAKGLGELAQAGLACGVVALTPGEAARSCGAPEAAAQIDFLLTAYADPQSATAPEGFHGVAANVAPAPDGAYVATPLACDVAWGPCLTCLQDATPERVAFMRAAADDERLSRLAVRCFGAGWPAPFQTGATCSNLPYAHRSASACVVFPPAREDDPAAEDGLLSDEALALCAADGCAVVRLDEAGLVAGEAPAPAQAAALDALAQACGAPAGGSAFASRRLVPYGGPTLDEGLAQALGHVADALAPRGLMQGRPGPRLMVTMLGYFGRGNFGDEYVLTTVEARLRASWPGATLVAVGEDPMHTLRTRGVYCLTLADTHALDEALRRSSAALVAAGLLFDQGIRWTMGKAELLSAPRYSTIPGIAAFVELARMNGVKTLFYGAGAGPLDVLDARQLVRLMGDLGAEFLTRDQETADLILSCGAPGAQVQAKADVAFLGDSQPTAFCDEWLAREGIDLGGSRLVAVSMREYESCPSDFAQRVAHALDVVAARHADVEFAACVLDPSDAALAAQIGQAMAHAGRLHVFDAGEDIAPMADLLGRCAAGFSMRYHCTLLLSKGGAPCVGLGYLPKVTSLYHDLGLDEFLLGMDAGAAQMEQALEGVLGLGEGRLQELAGRVGALRRKAGQCEERLNALAGAAAPAKARELPSEFFLREFPASAFYPKPASAAQLKAHNEVGRIRGEAARARAGQGNGVVPPAPPAPPKPDPAQVKIAQLTAELEQARRELARRAEQLRDRDGALAKTREELAQARDELAQAYDSLADTGADLDAATSELQDTHERLSCAEQILVHVRGDLDHARAELGRVQAERSELRDENTRLQGCAEMRAGRALCALPRAIQRAARTSKGGEE